KKNFSRKREKLKKAPLRPVRKKHSADKKRIAMAVGNRTQHAAPPFDGFLQRFCVIFNILPCRCRPVKTGRACTAGSVHGKLFPVAGPLAAWPALWYDAKRSLRQTIKRRCPL